MTEDEVRSTDRSSHDRYLALRSMIESERNFQNQVFTWFLGLNGFLFAALGFSWKASPDLVYVFGVLGIFTAMSWWVSSRVSMFAQRAIREVGSREELEADLPLVALSGGMLYGPLRWAYLYLSPLRAVPILLGLAWTGVIVVRIAT
jgi:hypothetical protein